MGFVLMIAELFLNFRYNRKTTGKSGYWKAPDSAGPSMSVLQNVHLAIAGQEMFPSVPGTTYWVLPNPNLTCLRPKTASLWWARYPACLTVNLPTFTSGSIPHLQSTTSTSELAQRICPSIVKARKISQITEISSIDNSAVLA